MTVQILIRHIALVLLLALLSGCAVTNEFGPYIGKVVDAETKEPIEGAVVFMQCTTRTGNPGGYTTHYAGFKEVLTDAQGEYLLALRLTALKPGHLWDYEPSITVFKPGYGVFPRYKGVSITPRPKRRPYPFYTNKYQIIALPKLRTLKERDRNFFMVNINFLEKIPFDQRKNVFNLLNQEAIHLGFKPIPIPTN
jgi:hypothetical protein